MSQNNTLSAMQRMDATVNLQLARTPRVLFSSRPVRVAFTPATLEIHKPMGTASEGWAGGGVKGLLKKR